MMEADNRATVDQIKKFQNPKVTLDGSIRASVTLKKLETLWINTGTLCNLTCKNCYIESSPKNDRLVWPTKEDVVTYLDEIKELDLPTKQIAFTGGEPFMNPHFMSFLTEVLERGFETLTLTNAYKVLEVRKEQLIDLKNRFSDKLLLRISLDHYTQEVHEQERGKNTFLPTLKNIKWLSDEGFNFSVAGRMFTDESAEQVRQGYKKLFTSQGIKIEIDSPGAFILFPEMDEEIDVPEITTDCFGILNKRPEDLMCSSSRMIVKRKGMTKTTVLPCTLLPYDPQFEMGHKLKDAEQTVYLNHPHCAKFCVLGGASCTG